MRNSNKYYIRAKPWVRNRNFTIHHEPDEHECFTKDETKGLFLSAVNDLIDYWNGEGTTNDPVGGVAFSIMSLIDGCSVGMPAFRLNPVTSKVDFNYLYDRNLKTFQNTDIGGGLHEDIHRYADKYNRIHWNWMSID